jgi:ATP-dependent Clp protease adaptor protein ClpS
LFPDTERESEHLEELAELLEPRYKIFIHNDDVTPFDFVIMVLQRFFELDLFQAEAVTFTAHTEGVAYVATLPRAEALQRVGKAHFAASLEGYPLTFTVEPE